MLSRFNVTACHSYKLECHDWHRGSIVVYSDSVFMCGFEECWMCKVWVTLGVWCMLLQLIVIESSSVISDPSSGSTPGISRFGGYNNYII